MIERLPVDRFGELNRKLGEWKALRADGWDLTALVEERRAGALRRPVSVVCLGYRRCSLT
ncbi:MAG TPA: hypothetical protein VLI07_18845 [Candidatus Binatus sp.]|nr:hypothetical protein [Candidatus Binatus sp.]